MANPELSQIPQIKETLEVVDPNGLTTVIGSAGIALHFGRNIKMPHPAQDLDLLARPSDILLMHQRLSRDPRIVSSNLNEDGIQLYPLPLNGAHLAVMPRATTGILPVDVISSFDDDLYPMGWYTAYQARVKREGEFTLPLNMLLAWKIQVGREKDISASADLLAIAEAEGLIEPGAVTSLRGILMLRRQQTLETQ